MGTLGEIATVAPAFWLARRSGKQEAPALAFMPAPLRVQCLRGPAECPERQTAAQFPRFQVQALCIAVALHLFLPLLQHVPGKSASAPMRLRKSEGSCMLEVLWCSSLAVNKAAFASAG